MRKCFLLYVVIILTFVVGCSEKTQMGIPFYDKDVISISLNSHPEWDSKDISLKSKQFTDASRMKTFIEAIENAQKMEGMLNYIAEFDLTVYFKDKSSAHYHLSLGGETEGEGLLVNLSNTLQGFRIQKEDTKLLREMINN
ncbi:hypothetical protein JCM9140_4862 [Halalkalibacter wakoensis JCM 9140]|uniref:YhfM-like domain-containing protein n=3 Tax=Halalkalibacter TaxID=2893056 RepID=W4Q970_9BACI|nr:MULTISPECIES: hypothetical protein [Halalkalibacter]GAE28611.1 hypothetical protein JCM9140_4862 [Halalkalibacter wakoensis JCM 9140]